jgi:hypothetical protein
MTRHSFLQFLFGGKTSTNKSAPTTSKRKTLTLESLEDRQMLAVTFETSIDNTYSDSSGATVNPNLVAHQSLLTGDFNGDGKADLLVIQQGGNNAYTYINDGKTDANPFSKTPTTVAVSGLLKTPFVGVGKLTGDGTTYDTTDDLLTAVMVGNVLTISVFRGRGNVDGGFYDQSTDSAWTGIQNFLKDNLSVNVPSGGSLHTFLGDIFLVENSNGYIDTLICSVGYQAVNSDNTPYGTAGTVNLVFKNNGSGGFTTQPTVLKAGSTTIPAALVAVGDVSGDKNPDYVTRASNNTQLEIYLNNGTKITTGANEFTGKTIGEVVVAKCDSGNAKKIIVALSDASGNNSLCVITVSGTTLSYSPHYAVDIVPAHIVTGNFNNDPTGYIDILISDGNIHQTLLGQSNGTFVKQSAVVAKADFLATYSSDFNGDGYVDVIAVGERFAWFISGNPNDPFTGTVINFAALGITPRDVAFGDFNGDGKMDIAVLNYAGNQVHVFYNATTTKTNVAPTFNRLATPLSVLSGKQLLVANFDNLNGDDIVVYGYNDSGSGTASPSLHTFLSTSSTSGGFGTAVITNLPTMPNTTTKSFDFLTVGEVTNDGYVDIVGIWNGSTGLTTARISQYQVLPNNTATPGSFLTNRVPVSLGAKTTTNITAAAIGDMNGDNRNDLVLLDADEKSVWIITQHATTSGTFTSDIKKSQVSNNSNIVTSSLNHLAVADFNGDGLLDVFVGMVSLTGGATQFRIMENDSTNKGNLKDVTNFTTVGTFNGAGADGLAFHVGRLDNNATADVVIVGGNTVKRFINTNKTGAEIGTVTLVFRDYNSNAELTYIDEWSTFYVEIWANTGSATAGVRNFETVITFDSRFFEVRFEEVSWGTNITGSYSKGSGLITLTGTVSGSGLQGNNTNALLGSVAFRPSSDTRSVALDFAYGAKPIDNGFAVQQSTVTTTSSVTGQSRYEVTKQVPLFPVIYDNNGDGQINAQDFLRFLNTYRLNITTAGVPAYISFCNVVSSNTTVDAADLLRFLNNYRLSKKDFRDNPTSPGNKLNYDNSFLNQSIPATQALQVSLASDMFGDSKVFDEIFNVSSVSEPLIQTTLTDQSTENQALLAYIASQEATKKADFDNVVNPVSETERLLAEGKL